MVDKCLELPRIFVKNDDGVSKVPAISENRQEECSPETISDCEIDEISTFHSGLPHPFGSFEEWCQQKQLKEKPEFSYPEQVSNSPTPTPICMRIRNFI